ncbi:hypothetical protein PG994_009343 [Apiospora phragmitis]|uniref:Uncharacterized protein n=1 Tax=Apiospora phragmitis TaxID=2905665 RepID=A0ABR1ULD6_9PEZI
MVDTPTPPAKHLRYIFNGIFPPRFGLNWISSVKFICRADNSLLSLGRIPVSLMSRQFRTRALLSHLGARRVEQDHDSSSMDMVIEDGGTTRSTFPTIDDYGVGQSKLVMMAMEIEKEIENEKHQLRQAMADAKCETRRLQQDLTETRNELSGTQKHLLCMQENRELLAENAACSELKEIIGSVDHWIGQHITPIFTTDTYSKQALSFARNNYFEGVICMVQDDPDLNLVAHLPETGEDVVHACILHWITQNIFHNGLRGISEALVNFTEEQEHSLKQEGEPLYAVRSWKAQAYYAWTKTPLYHSDREKEIYKLTSDLDNNLTMFLAHLEEPRAAVESLRSHIVRPAFALVERMMRSRDSFEVTAEHYRPLAKGQKRERPQIDFDWSECSPPRPLKELGGSICERARPYDAQDTR